jgi:predicted cytidylate kinase
MSREAMTNPRQVAVSGDLGSGKSSVARLLSERLGLELIGAGDVQRSIAASMGLSTLQANWLAEEKSTIDAQIDGELQRLGREEVPAILDARMAWHFVPSSFKVHLLVEPLVGAERLLRGRFSTVEKYSSVEEAREGADARFASERRRFLAKYGVDISRLENYDLVIETSDASPSEIADEIVKALVGGRPKWSAGAR